MLTVHQEKIFTNKENFINMIKLMEKLYFLTMDEQNYLDFIHFLEKIQDNHGKNKEIGEFLQTKIEEKLKTLVKIKNMRKTIENQIKEQYKYSLPFFTFFLQNEMNKKEY